MTLLDRARNYANGVKILHEWLGSDYAHVSKEEAQKRADICLTCPMNQGWSAPEIIANAIREQAKFKAAFDFIVDGELGLHTCTACLCATSLKVWIPKANLLRYSTPEDIARYDERCWLRNEP